MFSCLRELQPTGPVLPGTSARRLSSPAKFIQTRRPGVLAPHMRSCFVGFGLSTPRQSILDAPTGTHQANGSRRGVVPSYPFSIYKTGLAYNEKHYLPPGRITLPAADETEVVRGCGPKHDPITQIVFLHGRIVYHGAPSR